MTLDLAGVRGSDASLTVGAERSGAPIIGAAGSGTAISSRGIAGIAGVFGENGNGCELHSMGKR